MGNFKQIDLGTEIVATIRRQVLREDKVVYLRNITRYTLKCRSSSLSSTLPAPMAADLASPAIKHAYHPKILLEWSIIAYQQLHWHSTNQALIIQD